MTTDATRFLGELWRDGLLHLTAIPLHGRLRGRCFEHGEVDEAIAWAERQNRDANIYYSVNIPAASSNAAKLEKVGIGWIRGIWADLDPNKLIEVQGPTEQEPKCGRQRERERLDATQERLTEYDFPPTLIVDSGNGIQAIWLLTEPVDANESNAGRAEAIGAAIERTLGGTENTSNIDRVLRLPGFINRPTAKKRKLGRVEQPARLIHAGDRRYAWDELGDLRATIERDVVPDLIKAGLLPEPDPKDDRGPEILSRATDNALPAAIRALLKRDRRLRQRWANGKKLTAGKDNSASGLDWSLAIYLATRADDETIEAALRCYPPGQIGSGAITGDAADRQVERLLEAARARRESGSGDAELDFSDDGLALQLGELWAPDARYVSPWAQWLIWDGQRWRQDDTLLHLTRTRGFLRSVADGVVRRTRAGEMDWGTGDAEQDLAKAEAFAKRLRSAPQVAAVAGLARSNEQQAAGTDLWDRDPWLLNTPGGLVDLRTGKLRPSDPAAYCTKLTAVAPAPPGTSAPLWTAFLERIFRHAPELIEFMRRALGYALLGTVSEHVLIFCWGQGANGKSTLLNCMARMLGDYARTAPADLLLASQNERHPTEIAALRGARLVTAQELAAGRAWDEAKLKTLTGGDRLTARYMRQDFFEFEPQFTLMLAGNHKPSFRGVDEAIRRRVRLVPFTQNIPPEERDLELAAKLQAEWPAILRWCIDGCLAWQQDGLATPDCVRAASDEYLAGEDVFGQWLGERCIVSARIDFTRTSTLYDDWKQWAADGGLPNWSIKAFSRTLGERGFLPKREPGTGRAGYGGIGLAERFHAQAESSQAHSSEQPKHDAGAAFGGEL